MQNRYYIYQLMDGKDMRPYWFASYAELRSKELEPAFSNYERVYSADLHHSMTLNNIFRIFNLERPSDFFGHSLSVSDVIVISRGGVVTAHYVDSFGFKELPGFVAEDFET